MPLKESYVIWNNKGGVGKTTLTFHMATRYAQCNPDRKVLVIDLCPQANVTMALLSTKDVHGSKILSQIYQEKRTISFYLQKMTQMGRPIVQPKEYLTDVAQYNDQVPSNLVVLCGDMYLELVGRHLEHQRSGEPTPGYNPWVEVTSSIKSFIEGNAMSQGVVQAEPDTEWVVFIDTNPTFSVYTEIALVAGEKLIIPINADDFSKEAVQKMLDLVYGIAPEGEPDDFRAYRKYMFSSKASLYNVRKPLIDLVVNNRATSYDGRSSKAFRGMAEGIMKVLKEAYRKHCKCFSPKKEQESFEARYHVDIKDFHSTAVLSSHIGCPLTALSGKVGIFDETVKVDKVRVKLFLDSLDILVEKL